MQKFGAHPHNIREMDMDDIFLSRLKLLVIMAKAFLDGCPLGENRCRAILDNARHMESEAVILGGLLSKSKQEIIPAGSMAFDHLFYQRVKLLAGMVKSFAQANPIGSHRRKSLQNNLDIICRIMMFKGEFVGRQFLEVA